MGRSLRHFIEMKDAMKDMGGQTNAELATDMGVTEVHFYRCVRTNKIPYQGIIEWCLLNNVALEDVLLKEKDK